MVQGEKEEKLVLIIPEMAVEEEKLYWYDTIELCIKSTCKWQSYTKPY